MDIELDEILYKMKPKRNKLRGLGRLKPTLTKIKLYHMILTIDEELLETKTKKYRGLNIFDAEEYVRQYFYERGYTVKRNHQLRDGIGAPDFNVIDKKTGNIISVEVKWKNDGLRLQQIEWLKRNSDRPYILVWVKSKNTEEEEKKEIINSWLQIVGNSIFPELVEVVSDAESL